MNKRIAIITATACGLAAQAAMPLSTSNTFVVQTAIAAACNVNAGLLNFGTYAPGNVSPTDGSSTVSVYCTQGSTYTLKLDVGSGGGTYATRTLSNGTDTLNYNLYTTAGRTVILGDGTSSTQALPGTGAGLLTAATHTVYGRIPAAQDKPVGAYVSTITVTIEYTS